MVHLNAARKGRKRWLPAALLVGLVVASNLYLLAERPSYGVLFWLNLLSPVAYVGGFVLYDLIKPMRDERQ